MSVFKTAKELWIAFKWYRKLKGGKMFNWLSGWKTYIAVAGGVLTLAAKIVEAGAITAEDITLLFAILGIGGLRAGVKKGK